MEVFNKNIEYTFRLIQCHKDIPTMKGWYWYIDNLRMMQILMNKTVNRYAGTPTSPVFAVLDNYRKQEINNKAGKTLLVQANGHYLDDISYLLEFHIENEIINGRERINLIDTCALANKLMIDPKFKCFKKFGAIYVNCNYGFTIPHGQKILKEIKTKEFKFPFEKEIINISKWPNGSHYHLTSNCNREFKKKFNTYDEAEQHALKFVIKKNITQKSKSYTYTICGD
jgi:hypothetical protein